MTKQLRLSYGEHTIVLPLVPGDVVDVGIEVLEADENDNWAPEPEPEPEPQPAPTFWLTRVEGSDGKATVLAEGPDAEAATKVVFRMGSHVQNEGIPPYALFGDKPPGNLTFGTITGEVTAEALDAAGKVFATAKL